MRGPLGHLSLLLLLAASMLTPASSLAEGEDEAARIHFLSGTRYFDRGEYEAAVREFEAALELSGRPQLRYNLYLAYERLGRYQEAADMLEGYLAEVSEIEDREKLERRLENLRRRAAEERAIEEAAALDVEPSAELGPAPSERRARMPLPSTIALSVGTAGLLTFAVAGGLALGEDRSLAERCGADAGRTCTDADLASLERRTLVADVGLAVAAAGLATGLVLYFVLRDDDAESTSRLKPAPGGLALSF